MTTPNTAQAHTAEPPTLKAIPPRDGFTAARLFWGSQYIASVGSSDDTPETSLTMAEKLALRYNAHLALVEALEAIADIPPAKFSRDQLEHAKNTIEAMQDIANAALLHLATKGDA